MTLSYLELSWAYITTTIRITIHGKVTWEPLRVPSVTRAWRQLREADSRVGIQTIRWRHDSTEEGWSKRSWLDYYEIIMNKELAIYYYMNKIE